MKKLILSIAIGLVGTTTYAQMNINDSLYFNGDCVGYVKNIKVCGGTQDNFNGIQTQSSVNMDIVMFKALTDREITMLLPNNITNPIIKYTYDFRLPSDYLKQSANYRDQAIRTRLTTSVIGTGLMIIGGFIASRPSYSTETTQVLSGYNNWGQPTYTNVTTTTPNNDNRNMGLVVCGLGGIINAVGLGVSINLDFKANEMLRQGAVKFNLNGF